MVNVADAVREIRRTPGRSGGYIVPQQGRARWVGYEGDLDEGILRIDVKLPAGAECGTIVELFAQAVGNYRDRMRWTAGCPGCGHSIRHLYIVDAQSPEWGCRRCLGLLHRSTRHRRPIRAAYEIQGIRRDLGLPPGPIYEPPSRPPHMRAATFADAEAGILLRLEEYASHPRHRPRAWSAALAEL